MSLLDDARNREREARRGRSDDRYRSPHEAKPKDTYYRPEYGWIMSDADVRAELETKKQYDANVVNVQNQIAANKQAYQQSLEKGRSDISSTYAKAIQSIKKPTIDLVPVRVVNGNTVEATYHLPRAYVNDLNMNTFNKGDGTIVANWVDGGRFYNVDVKAQGGKMAGQELHDAFRAGVQEVEKAKKANDMAYSLAVSNLEKEKAATLKQFEANSAKNYAEAEKGWNAELDYARNLYPQRIATGKQQYEDKKEKYSQSVIGVDAGLLQSPTNQVNPLGTGR